jgi:tetratricopeptide (TPR) repeat protein
VMSRMGGLVGTISREEPERMVARGWELVAEDDLVTRARLTLDEAWIAWRFGREDEIAAPAHAGLELAHRTDDVPVLSAALDAITSLAWNEGRYRDAVASTRDRIDLLADAHGSLQLRPERSDSLHMMIESLVATGQYEEAADYAARARELDLSVGAVYSGWSRGLLPAFFGGDWDGAIEMAHKLREAWTASDRPTIAAMSAAIACVAAIFGYRGDEEAAADWFRFADSVAPPTSGQRSGMLLLETDVDLHRGRLERAAKRAAEVPLGKMWWRAEFVATRAEALVRGGGEGAPAAIAMAAATIGDHRYAGGVLLRARALRDDSEQLLRQALAVFEEIACPYQAARTGWLLGGADRAEAERTLAELGATPPAD